MSVLLWSLDLDKVNRISMKASDAEGGNNCFHILPFCYHSLPMKSSSSALV